MEEFNGLKIPTIYEKYNLEVISFEDFLTEIKKITNISNELMIITNKKKLLYKKINDINENKIINNYILKVDNIHSVIHFLQEIIDSNFKIYLSNDMTIYIENLHKLLIYSNSKRFDRMFNNLISTLQTNKIKLKCFYEKY